ncbi:MAG: N-6 DNA methylase [Paludibacteraceae bacterium]|nr:N-6 DNA methylase [Paludibacteraceae bacterium]
MQNNYFSVEAIVAKYVSAVNAQLEASPEYKDLNSPIPEVDLPLGFVDAPHQQLLAKLWSVVNGEPKEGLLFNELIYFIDSFKKNILTEQELEYLVSHHKETINHIFSLRDEWRWLDISLFEYSNELCDLMTKLLHYEEEEKLYIPYVEYGDLALRFPQCKISGNVSSPRIWAFCNIRLQANGIDYDIAYPKSPESLQMPHPSFESVDCILSHCDVFDSSLHNLYAALRPTGRMIAIVSPHTLGAMGEIEQDFRKMIVRDKSLEAIVQLPSDIFSTSNGSFFVMCLDKNKTESEFAGVVMADATFATRAYGVKSNLKRFDVERFTEAILHTEIKGNADICKRIPYNKVDADILLPAHYLLEKPKFAIGLNNVLAIADLNTHATKDAMPAVTIKNLTTSFKYANISVADLSPVYDSGKKEDFAVVTTPCVFMCSNGEKLLVGYLSEVPLTGVAVSSRICCFKVVSTNVASATLLLLEDYVVKQIIAMSVGKLMRKFDNNLLGKIKVIPLYHEDINWKLEFEAILQQQVEAAVPRSGSQSSGEILNAPSDTFKFSLEVFKQATLQQHERMQKKLYETIEQQKQEGVIQYENYRKSVRLRKHALTQSLSSFGSMFNALMNCRRRQSGFLDDSDRLSEINDLTVADAFAYLESRLKSIQVKLAAISDVEEDFGKPEYIEPIEFINSYIQSNKAGWLGFSALTGWENFITNRSPIDFHKSGFVLRKGEPINTFYFPKRALTRIFDNIIANAVAHGFNNPLNKDYKVKFSWEATGMDMVLTIENNGKSIPDGVDTSNILEYGFSTSLNINGHNGIGCSEIVSIMKEYDGDVKIISSPNEDYTVKYVLTFKRTNTVLSL